ncbi:MAG: HEAT repeat domain-containing protein [Actinomycetota bacterium]
MSENTDFQALVHDLESPEAGRRFWAIKHLAEHGPEAVEPLIEFLDRPDQDNWYMAARALGEIGDDRAVPALTRLYVRDASRVMGAPHFAAGEALRRIGKADTGPLINALMVGDTYAAQEAATLLGDLGVHEAEKALLSACNKTVSAILALGQLKSRIAVPLLLTLLRDGQEPYIKSAAAAALGCIGDDLALPGLTTALSDPEPRVRAAAVAALGHFASTAEEELLAVSRESDANVRSAALGALGAVGSDRAFDRLVEGVNEEDVGVRTSALKALAGFQDDHAGRVASILEAFRSNMGARFERRLTRTAGGSDEPSFAIPEMPPLSDIWSGLAASDELADKELHDGVSQLQHQAESFTGRLTEHLLDIGNLTSRVSGVCRLWSIPLEDLMALVLEPDESEDAFVLAAWRTATGDEGLRAAFLASCRVHGQELFGGIDDIPFHGRISIEVVREGISEAVEHNHRFRDHAVERLELEDSADPNVIASAFWESLTVR